MISLCDRSWAELKHAYGSAEDTPDLLRRIREDPTGATPDGKEAWEDLFSSICHQGDVYSASYAAVPHLVVAARVHSALERQQCLWLIGSIERARLTDHNPDVPEELRDPYQEAIREALPLSLETLAGVEETWAIKGMLMTIASLKQAAALSDAIDDIEEC